MSEADAKFTGKSGRRCASRDEPTMLPQWVIGACRPAAHAISRALWSISYRGTENIPLTGEGLLIASNHQTYLDPIWIGAPVRRPTRFLAWDEAFSWPVVGKMMELFGAWPLQVEGRDPSAIRRALQWLRGGGAVVIFPEGGRGERDG